jgi:hypothetical protein
MALHTNFTESELQAIWDYWRMSSTVSPSPYERLKWTSTRLHNIYPDISRMSFYKYLSGLSITK